MIRKEVNETERRQGFYVLHIRVVQNLLFVKSFIWEPSYRERKTMTGWNWIKKKENSERLVKGVKKI